MKSTFLAATLLIAATATFTHAQDTCAIRAGRTTDKLSFSYETANCSTTQHCHTGDSDMLWSRWSGVTPADLTREGATLDARIKADAGEIRCAGAVHEGALRGAYSFAPNAAFTQRMTTMGFDDLTPERLQGYVMLDVTLAYVQQMKDAGVTGMTSKNIMGLKALKVDSAYVKSMAAAGYPELDAKKLTSMKAVGVSPEKVQAIRSMGYTPTQEQLIQMSVFKIDAPFVERMKSRGFKDLTIAQLVKIKVFKLDE
jgi:hypothetical protein